MLAGFFTGTKLGRFLAAIGAIIAAVALAFFAGWVKRGGADKAASATQEVKTLKEVDHLQQQAGNKTDAQLAQDLTRPGS